MSSRPSTTTLCDIDLHPDVVPNTEMGYIFEELIRPIQRNRQRDRRRPLHTPRGDPPDGQSAVRARRRHCHQTGLTKRGIVRTLYDPACGTGGMLSVSGEYLRELNPGARREAFGQDHNPESYAVCGSDMLIKGHNIGHIACGSSFSKDVLPQQTFDYMLANPPFGVSDFHPSVAVNFQLLFRDLQDSASREVCLTSKNPYAPRNRTRDSSRAWR